MILRPWIGEAFYNVPGIVDAVWRQIAHFLRCFPTETTDRRRAAPLGYRFGRLDNDVGARGLPCLAFASQRMSVQIHGGRFQDLPDHASIFSMLPRIKGLVSTGT